MLGSSSSLRAAERAYAIALTLAALLALAILLPAAAQASGCTNTWTNTKGGSWFEGANWSKKAVPTSSEEACITEPGSYVVTMTQTGGTGTVTLKSLTLGAASGSQVLMVGSSASANAVLSTTAGISNEAHGVLTMVNGDSAANNVTLVGAIVNAGLFATELVHGGSGTLEGSFTNTGTLSIFTPASLKGANTLTNEGTLNVAEGETLTVASKEGSVTNGSGGKIVATGTGDVFLAGGKFTEGAGTTSGSKPVIVDDGSTSYTGAGASAIAVHGEGTLSGTSSSGQTLSIESTGGENALEKVTGGFVNGGAVTLTNGDASGNNAELAVSGGTLTNSGTLTTEPAHGGSRTLQGKITNTGTIAINANTSDNGAKGALANEGALDLASGVQLTASNESAFTNGAGGSIVASGSGDVLMEPGTTFTEGAGTTSGSKPVIIRDAALVYTGAGASAIAIHGTSTLSGNLASGQSLSVESTSGENADATAAAGFVNAGAITLTNGDASGNNAQLAVTGGTLTNSGTLTSELAHGGSRTLQGSITNTGKLLINANTSYNATKALLTNEGMFGVAESKTLTVSAEGAFTNGAGGSIVASGSGDVLMEPATTFTEGAGTTSGSKPVIVRDGALAYTGAGASAIALHGSSTLSGNVSAGQSLSIESTSGENALTTAAVGFTNAGAITLTNGDSSGNNASLGVTSGTLTNSGTIAVEQAVGGSRTLQGSITNTGSIAINANTAYSGAKHLLTNEGTLSIAEAKQLTASGENSVSNLTGGKIIATGSGLIQLEPGGAFTEGTGTTSGSKPVVVRDGSLTYTGSGASTIAQHGSSSTLSGNLAKGQVLLIESTSGENTRVAATAAFINSGTITLTNGDSSGNAATLAVPGEGLDNKNIVNVERAHGGSRTIEGAVKNEKKLLLSLGVNLAVQGSFTQTSKGQLQTTIEGPTLGKVSVTGAATIGGKLTIKQAKSKVVLAKEGESLSLLTSSGLTGTFSKVSGNKIKKTSLSYVPTYSPTGVSLLVS